MNILHFQISGYSIYNNFFLHFHQENDSKGQKETNNMHEHKFQLP
jgi:hypothetical protein